MAAHDALALARRPEVGRPALLDWPVARFLQAGIQARLSSSSPSARAGKTTLVTCCASELDPSLRIVAAEEVPETAIPLPNVAHMQTRPNRGERREVDLRRLVSGFLRMAPDVAIVGEVRDREALPLLLTLSSGVKGYTTIHAGSARQALTRLRFVCQLSDAGADLPISALNTLVSESIDLVVHCDRRGGKPQVTEILAVEDLQTGPDATAVTTTDLFRRNGSGAALRWTGQLPVLASRAFEAIGIDVRSLLAAATKQHPGYQPPPQVTRPSSGSRTRDGTARR